MPSKDWVQQRHPAYSDWKDAEDRHRASYTARTKDLIPYIVPYLFEETDEVEEEGPKVLKRSELGYGISLNESYLSEIFGHLRGAPARYTFGLLAGDQEEESFTDTAPDDTRIEELWEDATLENTSWVNFFLGKVLEWMLTSPGGLVVVDAPPGQPSNRREDGEVRPYFRFVPGSKLLDAGRGKTGFRWVKLAERVDDRTWDDDTGEFTQRIVVYSLENTENGQSRTVLRRFTDDGDPIFPDRAAEERVVDANGPAPGVDLGQFVDRQGQPTLPVVKATFGEHPDVPWMGAGLLMGLADIVIDVFNTVTEMREGYRDEVFAPYVHVGPEPESVKELIVEGSIFLALGDEENVSLERLTADATSVSSGMEQIRLAIEAWEQSAKRKAAKAQEREMSGVALQAEFQLDLAPLLTEVAETLDDVESAAMWIAAQFVNREASEDELRGMGVERDTNFRPEAEASRINRIVGEAKEAFGRFPSSTALSESFMRFLEAADLVDLDEEVEVGEGGESMTRRELIRSQVEDGFNQAMESQRNRDQGALPLAGGGGF